MSLSFLIFIGSVRDSTPPKPARLGLRVARACKLLLDQGPHTTELVDPLDYDLGKVFKPHFSYGKGEAPEALEQLASKIKSADGYVLVSPEYNHTMSPALMNLLNHFGGSLYGYKPSGIVTYSSGQWGGARGAMGMRNFLSELGCLPVSAMAHIPKAHEVFAEDGNVLDGVDGEAWAGYLHRVFAQLAWWGTAAKAERAANNEQPPTPAFKRDPSQRNAPSGSTDR